MPHFNVEVSEETLKRLWKRRNESDCRNWPDFLDKISTGEADVFVRFIMVDGKPAEKMEIVFQLGDYFYKMKDGELTTLSTPIDPEKVAEIAKILGGQT